MSNHPFFSYNVSRAHLGFAPLNMFCSNLQQPNFTTLPEQSCGLFRPLAQLGWAHLMPGWISHMMSTTVSSRHSQELRVSLWKITGVLGKKNTLPFVCNDCSNAVMLEAVCSRKLRNRLILGQLFLCSKAQFLWAFRDHWADNSVVRKWEHCILLRGSWRWQAVLQGGHLYLLF